MLLLIECLLMVPFGYFVYDCMMTTHIILGLADVRPAPYVLVSGVFAFTALPVIDVCLVVNYSHGASDVGLGIFLPLSVIGAFVWAALHMRSALRGI